MSKKEKIQKIDYFIELFEFLFDAFTFLSLIFTGVYVAVIWYLKENINTRNINLFFASADIVLMGLLGLLVSFAILYVLHKIKRLHIRNL